MQTQRLTRRDALKRTGAMLAAAAVGNTVGAATNEAGNVSGWDPFVYSMNTGTLRGHKLGLVRELEITAEAGYGAIEP